MREALKAALEALTNPSTTMTIYAIQLIKEALSDTKEWQGLTDAEVKEIIRNLLEDDLSPMISFAEVVQEMLKEKNNG